MPGNKGMLYQKKNCCGCKALQDGRCVLGYGIELEDDSVFNEPSSFYVPTEPCPKPRTIWKLNDLLSQAEAANS